jgi:hypothetical protein
MLYPRKNLLVGTDTFIEDVYYNYNSAPLNRLLIDYGVPPKPITKVYGAYDIEFAAVANNTNLKIMIPAKANAYYKPSCETNGDIHLFYYDDKYNRIGQTYDTLSQNRTGLTPAGTVYIAALLTNRGLGAGTYRFKNWQLEEVSIDGAPATPFSPYELGMKKSTLGTSINLLNPDVSKWRQGSADSNGNPTAGSTRLMLIDRVKMVPNTEYTVKLNNGYRLFMRNFSDQTAEISNSGWVLDGHTFTTPSNIRTAVVLLSRGDDAGLNTDEVAKALPMLAQGDWDRNIPYEEIMKPASLVPKKNLLVPFTTPGIGVPHANAKILDAYSVETNPTGNYQGLNGALNLNLKPNTQYTLSADEVRGTMIVFITLNRSGGATTYPGVTKNIDSVTFTTPSDLTGSFVGFHNGSVLAYGSAKNIQLEEGSVRTPFSGYELSMKPAQQYPGKNLLDPSKFVVTNVVQDMGSYIEVNPKANASGIVFPVGNLKPNTQYSITVPVEIIRIVDDNVQVRVYNRTKLTYISAGVGTVTSANSLNTKVNIGGSFNTGAIDPSDSIEIWVVESWINFTADDLLFRVWKDGLQLEEGSQTPFEPYELVMKPAILYPKKNLVKSSENSNQWLSLGAVGVVSYSGYKLVLNSPSNFFGRSIRVPAKPNTTYTVSAVHDGKISVNYRDANLVGVGSAPANYFAQSRQFTTPSTCASIELYLEISAVNTTTTFDNIQIEEGSVATPFEPYELGMKTN